MTTSHLRSTWFMFDDSAQAGAGQASILTHPIEIIRADKVDEVEGAIAQLSHALDKGLYAAGFFSYELGYAFEPSLRKLMPGNRQLPLLWFALSSQLDVKADRELASFFERGLADLQSGSLHNMRADLSKDDYLTHFEQVKELIASGDIYQVNLAFKLLFEYRGDAFSLYSKLRQRQPVSYGAFLQADDFAVLSFSPELFFKADRGKIHTRPMKGTIRRGVTREEDRSLFSELQNDVKNRAENLMIVDLMRNDFARICQLGSVEVSDLYRVDDYPTLHQMTSGVQGVLRKDLDLLEVIKALLPAGSIIGAPKIRAQQIIRELEAGPRGVYCGAMGIISRDAETGDLSAMFNVAIRTLTLFADGCGETGIGSGVVQDSQGDDEYEECLLKAKYLTMPDFKLIETMRLDADRSYYLLDRHLARLLRSCRALGFLCPLDELRKYLARKAKSLEQGTYRVRLVLDTGGRYEITATSIDPPDPHCTITFSVSDRRVDSNDSLLAHKTTRRELFDEAWAASNRQYGTQEVLFLNEKQQLTEGARSNLFIERDGRLLTPPLSCGLLPGTLREQLISEGRVLETVLTLDDLTKGQVYFANSVRGLQPAKLL